METHELTDEQFAKLAPHLPPQKPRTGRPRVRLSAMASDKGDSSRKARGYLWGRRIGVVITTKADQVPLPSFNREAFRERNVVERLINRLKRSRRVATRYEKGAANDRAMVTVAAILLWL
jgi:transposase